MYILDYSNARVQKWFPGDSYGRTVIAATMSNPHGMKTDLGANIVIADTSYHRILLFGLTCRKFFIDCMSFLLIKHRKYLAASTTTTSAPPSN